MKKLYSTGRGFIILFLLTHVLLGVVSNTHAQSVQVWSEPINLSMSGAASDPSIVADSKGTLHVLWTDEFAGFQYVNSADGINWSSPKAVNFPFDPKGKSPLLFSDAQGHIHMFWVNEKSVLTYAQSSSEGLDTPSSWRRTILDNSVYDFDAAMDTSGGLHISYIKNPKAPTSEPSGAYYRHSLDGGLTWQRTTLLYESTYFRSITADSAHIRLAVSDELGDQSVYIVWDDRLQKRIFMATSEDSGSTWNPVQELITPQANQGFKTPYQADINVLQNKILVTWQLGEPGTQCVPYSWTSTDSGKTWDDPVRILSESTGCPESNEFISIDPAYSVSLFTIQGNLYLSAWNGSQWSSPEIQTGPSSMTNPTTFDPVLLGCERTAAYKNQLYVVGCDQGTGKDVWFITRQIDSLGNFFPAPSAWGGDTSIITVSQTITSLSSITDETGNVHLFWVQASGTANNSVEPEIIYARWNESEWSNPVPIFTGLNGLPLNLSLQIDKSQRLLLSWVDQQTGDLSFAWANSERANIPLEWVQPVVLSGSSELTNSPDILVDASNRIVIAYAVALNENRGIYIIQSTDLGATWSAPVRVFDAVSVNWQMVDQPKLAVTHDGRLHILFTKYTLLGKQQPVGVFYSQSTDGGNTWTTPEAVSEQPIQWSQIVASKEKLYRFWQEKNKSVITTYYQSSSDGGNAWDAPRRLSNDASILSQPSISMDVTGNLHLLQMTQTDTRNLQEWEWNHEHWQLSGTRKLSIPEQNSQVVLTSGITSRGKLYAILQFEQPLDNGVETGLFTVNRSLETAETVQPFAASISTPSGYASNPTETFDLPPTSTPLPALANSGDTQAPVTKNLVGLFLIVIVVFLILIFIVPRRKKT